MYSLEAEKENSETRDHKYSYSLEAKYTETRGQNMYSLEAQKENSETRDHRYLQFRG